MDRRGENIHSLRVVPYVRQTQHRMCQPCCVWLVRVALVAALVVVGEDRLRTSQHVALLLVCMDVCVESLVPQEEVGIAMACSR